MSWKLFDRKTKRHLGYLLFKEKWVEPITKSGVVFYSDISEIDDTNFYGYTHPKGSVFYGIEAYGIGTVHPKTFTERGTMAPIERYEFNDLKQAKDMLKKLKERK